MEEIMSKPILCIDFDGVIHSYTSGWQGANTVSDPVVPGFFEWAEQANQFFKLIIYSSRSKEQSGIDAMRHWLVQQFEIYCSNKRLVAHADSDETDNLNNLKLKAEGGLVFHLYFTHEKPSAFLTLDDRAIRFDGNWEAPSLAPDHLIQFKPWNKQ
jgi:hypothetical protein